MKKIIVLTLCVTLSSCAPEITNLRTAKDIVKEYYESGKYDEEMKEVIKDAKEKFDKVEVKKNSVVIFDVDDTALSNYEISKRLDYGYDFKIIQDWVLSAKLPAIKHTKELYDFLKSKNIKLIFLTGRNFEEYDATYKNLISQGYTDFDTLIVRSEEQKKIKSQIFKSGIREELTKSGYEIIGTVGDQWTDLNEPYSGIQIKLPNYLYEIK
jgi:acid phosphatase